MTVLLSLTYNGGGGEREITHVLKDLLVVPPSPTPQVSRVRIVSGLPQVIRNMTGSPGSELPREHYVNNCPYLTENTLSRDQSTSLIQVPWVITTCTLTDYPKDVRQQVSLSHRYYLPVHAATYPTPSSVQRPTSHGRCLLYYTQPTNTDSGKMASMCDTK